MKEGYSLRILNNSKVKPFLVSMIMLAILLCFSSQAQADQSGDYTYTVTAGKAQITKYIGPGGAVTIPSTFGGAPVTSIGDNAFARCTSLKNVSIPISVTSIGYGAFAHCNSLTTISIPEGVTSIGNFPFYYCTSLTSVSVAVNNSMYSSIEGVLYNKAGTILIEVPAGLTSLSIPAGVTSIGHVAFSDCPGLTSISVAGDNSNYSSIEGVLYNKTGTTLIKCPLGLTSLNIPAEVKSIGHVAFADCIGLTTITIPTGVTSIGNNAFDHCPRLTTISFNSATTTIDESAETIPVATKIIGYSPSTAKDYAIKNNRTFEVSTPVPTGVTTLAGSNSYETSLEIAKQFVKEEGKLNNLVVATGHNWPDALSGGSLAGAVNSPMLMLPINISEASNQLDFISNNVNSGGTIYILGGSGAVSTEYEDAIKTKEFEVKRLWGPDAIDTSVAVANELVKLKPITGVVIVGRSNYVDAVSIASYANKEGLPILITERDETKDSVIDFIKDHSLSIKNVYIIGGTAVVGNNVVPTIAKVLSLGTDFYDAPVGGNIVSNNIIQRLGGMDSYDTNNLVGNTLIQDTSKFTVVEGDDFISALSGGAYAGHHDMFLMIVPSDVLAIGNMNVINSRRISKQNITAFGNVRVLSELLSNLK